MSRPPHLARRLPLAAVLCLCAACDVATALGGGTLDASVVGADGALDADATATDGADGARVDGGLDAGVEAGRSRFSSTPDDVTAADFDALREAMVGIWYGATSHAEVRGPIFEVEFSRDGHYRTYCILEDICEPFGVGSDGEVDGQLYELIHLDNERLGFGVIESPDWNGARTVGLWGVRYTPVVEALTFRLTGVEFRTHWVPGDLSGSATVALARGSYPDVPRPPADNDGGMDAGMAVDAGAPDTGAAPDASSEPDASDPSDGEAAGDAAALGHLDTPDVADVADGAGGTP